MDLNILSQLRWGAGDTWSPGTPPQKAGPPGLHHVKMGKSPGISTPWLPPMFNQSF